MNKIDAIFDEYVKELYRANFSKEPPKPYQDERGLCFRIVLDVSEIVDLETKLGDAFRNKPYQVDKPKNVKLRDRRYNIAPGQRLYYGFVKDQSGQTVYTVQICPWMPFSENEKTRLRKIKAFEHFPENPVTVVFRKILP